MNIKRSGSAVLLICMVFLTGCSAFAEKESTTDISEYETYYGSEAEHRTSNQMVDISIFPEEISESADVETFDYNYYNPWDPNYTTLLVLTYDDAEYETELQRLSEIESTSEADWTYGVTGFPYELCAITTNEYGIVYAMTNADENRFIYVEISFCNFFSDMDYEEIIGEEYLPEGFDATEGNPVRAQFEESES